LIGEESDDSDFEVEKHQGRLLSKIVPESMILFRLKPELLSFSAGVWIRTGIWIRIGSGLNGFVDPDPDFESRSWIRNPGANKQRKCTF
jgi:hypothetical protein